MDGKKRLETGLRPRLNYTCRRIPAAGEISSFLTGKGDAGNEIPQTPWTIAEGVFRVRLGKQGVVDCAHRSRASSPGIGDRYRADCDAIHLYAILTRFIHVPLVSGHTALYSRNQKVRY